MDSQCNESSQENWLDFSPRYLTYRFISKIRSPIIHVQCFKTGIIRKKSQVEKCCDSEMIGEA